MRRLFPLSGDGVAGFCVAVIGAILIVTAQGIRGFGDDPVGPKFLPVAGGALLVLFGLWLAVISRPVRNTEADRVAPSAFRGFHRAVLPLGLLGILYALALPRFGYIIPTLLVLPGVFYIFGTRSPMVLLRDALATTIAFYLFFFVLFGVYDPPGEWLDISGIFR